MSVKTNTVPIVVMLLMSLYLKDLSANQLTDTGSTNKPGLNTDLTFKPTERTYTNSNQTYIVDNLIENVKASGSQVKFDIFITKPAAAVIEIYDANGKRVGYKIAEGNKRSTTVIGDMKDKITGFIDTIDTINSGGDLYDPRNPTFSKKTEVTLTVPEGGSFKVTKSSNLAKGVNLAYIAIEFLSKLGMPTDDLGSKFMASLVDKIIKSALLGPKLAITGEADINDLYSELLGIAVGVAQDLGVSAIDKIAEQLGKKAIGPLLSGAEFIVFGIQSEEVIRDLNKNIYNDNDLAFQHSSDDYKLMDDTSLQLEIDGLHEHSVTEGIEPFDLQGFIYELSDDVNNTTKVESTESNNPTNSTGSNNWRGSILWNGEVSGQGSNFPDQLQGFLELETSNNAQSPIINGVNTPLVIQSSFDDSGNTIVDVMGLTIGTGSSGSSGKLKHFEDKLPNGDVAQYSYVGWGSWNVSHGITITANNSTQKYTTTQGFWLAGNETSSQNMPRMGSASYNGSAIGDLHRNGINIYGGVRGTVGLNMDFANRNFTGNMNLKDFTGAPWSDPRLSGEINTDTASFAANNVSGGDVRIFSFKGKFYGPKANEVGGNWSIQKNGESAAGLFRAK